MVEERLSTYHILSRIILYVRVNELSDFGGSEVAKTRVCSVARKWVNSSTRVVCSLNSLAFFTGPVIGCLPSVVIVHSHQLFLHIRLTLQTLLVTLPHQHQRLPPERLSGILAEIYSPHRYASETCWSEVISLSLSLFVFYVWSWLTL